MRRREFITLLGGAVAAWPLAARAQQPERMRRIGVLINTVDNDPDAIARLSALQKALREFGWDEGRNLQIDTRWGVDADRIRRNAAELSRSRPTSSWPTGRRQRWRCSRRPEACRSCSWV
jgi:putative tryptophan/tyrosine transport system substrate-binding protein